MSAQSQAAVDNLANVAIEGINGVDVGLDGGSGSLLPASVSTDAKRATQAVKDTLASAKILQHKLGQLDEIADRRTMPAEGVELLRREAHQQAEAELDAARREFQAAQQSLDETLIDAAVPEPTKDATREFLDRQSLELVLGDAKGAQAQERLLALASDPKADPGALALAIGSPYGRSLLFARSVQGVDSFIARLRRVAAESTLQRGGTPRQRHAAAARLKVSGLPGAMAVASQYAAELQGK